MKLERHYLNWHSPMLPAVADFLLQRFAKEGVCDLSQLVIVTPSRRAGRRLQELLAWQCLQWQEDNASHLLLIPPKIITTGQVPEVLLRKQDKIAGELQSVSAWTRALQETPPNILQQLFAEIPVGDDYLGWWSLGQELHELHRELAADAVSYDEVKTYCATIDATAGARWGILQIIAGKAQEHLRQSGFIDRDVAIERALQLQDIQSNATIILVSVVDLNRQVRHLLEASDCNIITLIHADTEEAEGFGELGQLVPEYWQHKIVPLDNGQIHPVERPIDQVMAVSHLLESLSEVPGDCIAIGMGEEKLAPMLERALEYKGRATHRAMETTLAQTAPLRLMALLADFIGDSRPRKFQLLALHPDYALWLERRLPGAFASKDLQTHIDDYLARYLPVQMTATSFKLPSELQQVLTLTTELISLEPTQLLPVGDWVALTHRILETIYEGNVYGEDLPGESEQFRAFDALGGLLDEITKLSESHSLRPLLSFNSFIRFLVQLAQSKTLPQTGVPDAVELLGWLELHLDDAPILMITNVNEGLIPGNIHASPFLSDSLRSRFHLLDNNRRYARDAYLLTAIYHSRQKLDVIFAGRSQQGDPLQPSRLLFACAPETVRERVQQYYQEGNTPHVTSPPFLNYGDKSYLSEIPRPEPLPDPLSRLNVTAFRSYLACPYRFYLRFVRGLEMVGEIAMEMEPTNFGTLLHSVLDGFAKDVLADQDWNRASEEQISQRLNQLLDQVAIEQFGKARMASVEIQLHQAQRRLQTFARNQKRVFDAGWQIHQAECKLEYDVEVDAQLFNIHGRVDRIDFHPIEGAYRILDYKIGDSFRKPEQTHRTGPKNDKRWTDLQLPLYRLLAKKLSIQPAMTQVGYFGLPADLGHPGLEMAAWGEEDFAEAQEIAFWIIRQLRQQIYWPPSEDGQPSGDIIGAICRDADPRGGQG